MMTVEWKDGRVARIAGQHDELTWRESQIAALVAVGWSNRRIAEHVGIEEQTAKNHLRAIFTKLGCENRTGLAVMILGGGR